MHTYIIKKPIITEKSLALAAKENTYLFEVSKNAEKNQLKKIIEELFKVKVISVNTVMGHRGNKKTGRKRLSVVTERTKKALIKLKEGDRIELFDLEGMTK